MLKHRYASAQCLAAYLRQGGDKASLEQLKLINELEPEDKAMVFRLIDTIVTKKKFKDFVATMQ